MDKEGFRNREKINRKDADNFAKGADVGSNSKTQQESTNKKTVEGYSTKLYPETIKEIRAYAYVERLDSQRKVIEKAMACLYSSEEKKQEYLEIYDDKKE